MKNIFNIQKNSNSYRFLLNTMKLNYKFSTFVPKKIEYKFLDELEKIIKSSEIETDRYIETVNKYDSIYKQEYLKNNNEIIKQSTNIMNSDEISECDDLVDELLSFTNTELNLFNLVLKENSFKNFGVNTTEFNESYPFCSSNNINIFPLENPNWSSLSSLNFGSSSKADSTLIKEQPKEEVKAKVDEPKVVRYS